MNGPIYTPGRIPIVECDCGRMVPTSDLWLCDLGLVCGRCYTRWYESLPTTERES